MNLQAGIGGDDVTGVKGGDSINGVLLQLLPF